MGRNTVFLLLVVKVGTSSARMRKFGTLDVYTEHTLSYSKIARET